MGGSTGGNAVRFWRFGMTQDGVRRMTLVPVVKNGTVGFHDAVTGAFFGPSGGTLTAGPALETTGYEDVASWSETVLRTDPLAPRFAPGLACTPTGVFDNGRVEGALERAGAGGCSLVAELSPTADFAAFATVPAGSASSAGAFSRKIHLRPASTRGLLLPGETAWIRLRAVASEGGRTALSDATTFVVPDEMTPGLFILVR